MVIFVLSGTIFSMIVENRGSRVKVKEVVTCPCFTILEEYFI